jgi:hypothetical protein
MTDISSKNLTKILNRYRIKTLTYLIRSRDILTRIKLMHEN